MAVQIKIDVEGLEKLQRKKEQMVRDLHGTPMLNAMRKAALLVVRDAKVYAPVYHGRLRASITPDITTEGKNVVGRVGSKVHYAPYMELGTGTFAGRPRHFPPPSALKGWARSKGLNAYVVARAIGRRGGLRPRRFLQRAMEQNRGQIKTLLGNGVNLIVRK